MQAAENIHDLPAARIQAKLSSIYREGRIWSYGEQCLLLDLMRRPTVESECDAIINYYSSGPKFFPMSMMVLLGRWDEILDRAAITSKPKIHGPVKDPKEIQIRKLTAEMTMIRYRFYDDTLRTWRLNTESEQKKYNDLHARKQELRKL